VKNGFAFDAATKVNQQVLFGGYGNLM